MANCAAEYVFYNEEAGKRYKALSENGMKSVFIYSPNVYVNGSPVRYDEDDRSVRTVAFSGVVYAPVSLFTDFLCAAAEISGSEVTLTSGDKTASVAAITSAGILCLPVVDTARALGFAAGTYYEGRLAVIGTESDIAELDSDPELANAGAYLTLGKYDPYTFTSEDYKAARSKWKTMLVGSPELNDMTNETIASKINNVTATAQQKWQSMNRGEDRVILWGTEPPVESVELERQYGGLRAMARAWGTYGSELYQNEELARDIIDGVEWMYGHMYGEAEIAGTGWRDAHLFNWYYWYISAAEFLTDIFFIMEERFTLEEKRKYLKCFEWCTTFMRHWFRRDAALSRICVCTKVGIACEYPNRLYDELVDFDMLLGLEETVEGPHVDYVQWTHGMPYNNAYGVLNLDRVLLVAATLAGTPVEFTNPKQYNQFMLVKYMFEPAMYKCQAFQMFRGRSTDSIEVSAGGQIIGNMLRMYGMFGEDEDNYIAAFVKRNLDKPDAVAAVKGNADISGCTLVDRIMSDTAIPSDSVYEYAHAWFTGDRAAQQRNNYAIGIALSSKREPPYECINSANKTGWYTGDGATYLYTDYDRHQYDGRNFITKNINVAYRFPGTTEDSQPRVIRSIRSSNPYYPENTFAGSMQIEDKYIVASMDFRSLNFEGPDDNPDDSGYGGSQPIHHNDLRAKKSWFCFDDEIVCLGAGITSTMDSEVHTTVEHRRIVDKASDVQTLDGEKLPQESFERIDMGASFVNMHGHAGYVFLGEAKTYVHRYTQEEANAQDFFEVRIEHGKNPADATYAYAILPYASDEKLAEYAKLPDIEIIENSARVQAVRENTLGITAYAFHEAVACCGVAVSEPCILSVSADTVALSDPTHELDSITVTVDAQLECIEKSEKMRVEYSGGKTVITVDIKAANGRKFEMRFHK